MKINGRKQNAAYELYGFIPRVANGKHSAICMSCNRILQNTAAVRLQRHRNACVATRAAMGHSVHLTNSEKKNHKRGKNEAVHQQKSPNLNIKTEENNSDFDDTNTKNDNVNNIYYEEDMEIHIATKVSAVYPDEIINSNTNTEQNSLDSDNESINKNGNDVEAAIPSRRLHKKLQGDEMDNTFNVSCKSKESCDSINHEKNPIHSPVSVQQPPEPFESYHAATNTSSTLTVDIDENIKKANDEDLINIEEELNAIQNVMPRSKESEQLQDELFKAETEYYRCKAAYFTKLTENCSVKRTLMLLESRKLQLEIEKLRKES